MKARRWQTWLVLIGVLAAVGADGPGRAIHLGGDGLKPSDWTVAQLQQHLAGEIKPVEYNSHGAKHTFDCAALLDVLKAGGANTDFVMQPGASAKVKNPQLRLAVVVRGRDGYTVVFSFAELLPDVGNRAVWVALDEDGKPLSESDGPVRLIVPDDKMPARSVHQIESIEVANLSTPATRP